MSGDKAAGTKTGSGLDTGTRLAFKRTYFANERTQMAWIRTSLALISFGFGIAKFFQYLHENQGAEAPPMGPRTVGMLMISIGLVSLVVANIQHRQVVISLSEECPGLPRSTAGATAAVIMVMGVLAFIVALV